MNEQIILLEDGHISATGTPGELHDLKVWGGLKVWDGLKSWQPHLYDKDEPRLPVSESLSTERKTLKMHVKQSERIKEAYNEFEKAAVENKPLGKANGNCGFFLAYDIAGLAGNSEEY